jgi:hypothetical protein
MLASCPLKILAVFLSPSWPIVEPHLSACFDGRLQVLKVGDLNAKYVDWNSRPTTTRGKLLRDYASGNSSLIYRPDTPTTPHHSSATSDVLDIVSTKDRKVSSVSQGMLSNKLRSPVWTDRHNVAIILSQPTSPTWLQADRIGKIPDQPRKDTTVHPVNSEWGGNPHERERNVQGYFGRASGDDSQESPSGWPMATYTALYTGWNTTEEQVEEAVANHQAPWYESWGQPFSAVTHLLNEWHKDLWSGML